ncbi:MAG: nuclear transport factor 2 family protein [Euryarchaeota archaeon]|nr:nuclear transport factor 2 family protein [Euryarchaeota archaeon]
MVAKAATGPTTRLAAVPKEILDALSKADLALHNGDARPRKQIWSHEAPVTLFGAVETSMGWDDVGKTFDWLASRFSNCQSSRQEVIAAQTSGDLAYVVAIEHTTVSMGGAPPAPYKLRVTTILRREGGQWKVVHRHGSPVHSDSRSNVWQLKA